MSKNSVHVDCRIVTETDKAVLIQLEPEGGAIKGREVWVPLSQVDEIHKERPHNISGHDGWILVSRWFARKEGLE